MRVDFTNLGLEPPEKSKPGRAGQTGTAAAAATANRGAGSTADANACADRVRFSFDPARVHSLATQALAAPEVRQEKVAPLRQSVANGNYAVDSGKVADAIAAELANGRIR